MTAVRSEVARAEFEAVVRRHERFVLGVAPGVVRDPSIAEDVAQEAFYRAWRSWGDFRGESSVRTWLFSITRNVAINQVQRRREMATAALDDRANADDPAREAEAIVMAESLRMRIRELPPDQRDVVELFEFEGLSYAEISRRLEIPVNTVRTRLHRASTRLAEEMSGWR